MIDAWQVVGNTTRGKERRTVFGTTSWRRTLESLRVAIPYVSHRFTLVLAFLGSLLVGVVWLFVLGLCFCVCFCFGWLPTISRCRSFLPDLMTVRAVMVRAAMEKKKRVEPIGDHHLPDRCIRQLLGQGSP